jgi:UDP-N-acetylglucosamine 2-epimerase (non-hydrolysing)/GDP/UDP-N,N'-diacetylbacillosamine 2-epimerase (hydrolysing)
LKRKIAVVTGTRAEYGILKPVLQAIRGYPGLELSLVVTGMHLSHDFGYTVSEIEKDGYEIAARVDMMPGSDNLEAMAESIGKGTIGMAQAWAQLKPEIIVILGDRVEPLAAAIAGAYMNLPLAHIHGGDICGNIDDLARHAITRFAHIHFPATKKSSDRIIKMGEEKWRVHMVGSPAVDAILETPPVSAAALGKKLGLDLSRPFILLTQHPVTTQVDDAAAQMKETLEAIVAAGCHDYHLPEPDAGADA